MKRNTNSEQALYEPRMHHLSGCALFLWLATAFAVVGGYVICLRNAPEAIVARNRFSAFDCSPSLPVNSFHPSVCRGVDLSKHPSWRKHLHLSSGQVVNVSLAANFSYIPELNRVAPLEEKPKKTYAPVEIVKSVSNLSSLFAATLFQLGEGNICEREDTICFPVRYSLHFLAHSTSLPESELNAAIQNQLTRTSNMPALESISTSEQSVQVACPAGGPKQATAPSFACKPFQLLSRAVVPATANRLYLGFELKDPPEKRWWVGDVNFDMIVKPHAYPDRHVFAQFVMWSSSLFVLVLFLAQTRTIPQRNWQVEHRWGFSLLLLTLVFNDLFLVMITGKASVPGYIFGSIMRGLFMTVLFLIWLILLEALRKDPPPSVKWKFFFGLVLWSAFSASYISSYLASVNGAHSVKNERMIYAFLVVCLGFYGFWLFCLFCATQRQLWHCSGRCKCSVGISAGVLIYTVSSTFRGLRTALDSPEVAYMSLQAILTGYVLTLVMLRVPVKTNKIKVEESRRKPDDKLAIKAFEMRAKSDSEVSSDDSAQLRNAWTMELQDGVESSDDSSDDSGDSSPRSSFLPTVGKY